MARRKPKKLTAKLKKQGITQAMLNKAYKTGGITLRTTRKRTGSSSKLLDKLMPAKPAGKRLSRNGNVYYESRKNRSDNKNWI